MLDSVGGRLWDLGALCCFVPTTQLLSAVRSLVRLTETVRVDERSVADDGQWMLVDQLVRVLTESCSAGDRCRDPSGSKAVPARKGALPERTLERAQSKALPIHRGYQKTAPSRRRRQADEGAPCHEAFRRRCSRIS